MRVVPVALICSTLALGVGFMSGQWVANARVDHVMSRLGESDGQAQCFWGTSTATGVILDGSRYYPAWYSGFSKGWAPCLSRPSASAPYSLDGD